MVTPEFQQDPEFVKRQLQGVELDKTVQEERLGRLVIAETGEPLDFLCQRPWISGQSVEVIGVVQPNRYKNDRSPNGGKDFDNPTRVDDLPLPSRRPDRIVEGVGVMLHPSLIAAHAQEGDGQKYLYGARIGQVLDTRVRGETTFAGRRHSQLVYLMGRANIIARGLLAMTEGGSYAAGQERYVGAQLYKNMGAHAKLMHQLPRYHEPGGELPLSIMVLGNRSLRFIGRVGQSTSKD